MEPDIKSIIAKQAGSLDDMIRQYSIGQKQVWRTLPCLALLADTYMNPDSMLQKTYETGYWDLSYRSPAGKAISVDCETGELCYYIARYGDRGKTQIPPGELVSLAYNLGYLDAQQIADSLRERVRQRGGDENKPRLTAWRENRMKEFGLDPNTYYTRTEKKPRLYHDDNLL